MVRMANFGFKASELERATVWVAVKADRFTTFAEFPSDKTLVLTKKVRCPPAIPSRLYHFSLKMGIRGGGPTSHNMKLCSNFAPIVPPPQRGR